MGSYNSWMGIYKCIDGWIVEWYFRVNHERKKVWPNISVFLTLLLFSSQKKSSDFWNYYYKIVCPISWVTSGYSGIIRTWGNYPSSPTPHYGWGGLFPAFPSPTPHCTLDWLTFVPAWKIKMDSKIIKINSWCSKMWFKKMFCSIRICTEYQ